MRKDCRPSRKSDGVCGRLDRKGKGVPRSFYEIAFVHIAYTRSLAAVVLVSQGNKEGAIALKFKAGVSAEKCIEVMHGRFFGGRKVECAYFDGKTDYRVKESEEDEAKRLKEFGDWLEGGGDADEESSGAAGKK